MNKFDFKVSRIFHAGYVFEADTTRIIFDPIFENPMSQNCYAYPSIEFDHSKIIKTKFDAVFISHIHDDHFSLKSLIYLDRSTPIYMFSVHEEPFALIKSIGFKNVFSLELEKQIQVGDFIIKPHRALDADVDCLFELKISDYRILNVVDSWIDLDKFTELKAIKPWDLVLWPFQTMREIEVLAPTRFAKSDQKIPIEHQEQLQQLSPKYLVPSSCQFIHENWSWYRQAYFPISYQSFASQIKHISPNTEVLRMNPGQTLQYVQHQMSFGTALDWITPVGLQDLDYEYNPDVIPTSTAAIAQYLEAVDKEHKKRVFNFCETEISTRYAELELSSEDYFLKPLNWCLKIFDSTGQAYEFFYEINQNILKPKINCQLDQLGWQTEIPLMKLYHALESGETLSSLYIRINEPKFNPTVEENLLDVDILEDPLIRTLYTGRFQVLFPERYGVHLS